MSVKKEKSLPLRIMMQLILIGLKRFACSKAALLLHEGDEGVVGDG